MAQTYLSLLKRSASTFAGHHHKEKQMSLDMVSDNILEIRIKICAIRRSEHNLGCLNCIHLIFDTWTRKTNHLHNYKGFPWRIKIHPPNNLRKSPIEVKQQMCEILWLFGSVQTNMRKVYSKDAIIITKSKYCRQYYY